MSTKSLKSRRAAVAAMPYPYAWPPESVLNPGAHMKWSKKVVFDFHQVCTNWTKQFVEFVNRTYGYNIDPNTTDFYNMQFDPSNPMTPEQFEDAFRTFARLSRGGYGDLEAYPGIKETMEEILAAGIGIEIWTWTPGAAEKQPTGQKSFGTGIAQRVTMDLVRTMGLPIDAERDVRFMAPTSKKWEMAEEHIPLIIEDNPETAVSVGMGAGHAVIMVPESYNQGMIVPNVLPLKNRKQLARTVISFFEKLDAAGVLL
jgi:hypothetical protein